MKYNNDNADNTASASYRQPHTAKVPPVYSNEPTLQVGSLTSGRGLLTGEGDGDGDDARAGAGVDGSGSTTYTSGMYVNNPQWGDKCYILDDSDTNITAQEEYAKFDFQVKSKKQRKETQQQLLQIMKSIRVNDKKFSCLTYL